MYKIRNMPPGIYLFVFLFIILEVYYFFYDYFVSGLYYHHGYTIGSLTHIPYLLITSFLEIVVIVALIAVLYGFVYKTYWARKFTMLFILWSAMFPLWGIIIGNNLLGHFILLLIYVFCVYYLMTERVLEYFKVIVVFKYGPYTLYKRQVTLESGKILTIFFFSSHTPKSGTPCPMPEGYEVGINSRSKMPYLQKIGKPKPFKYNDYTLYKKTVTLLSGKTLTIFFFSSGKPKSGEQCPKPDGYIVGINPRSKMPYLKKESNGKTIKTSTTKLISSEEKEQKTSTTSSRKPANVIYVVSKPQPGEVRGDWAVRSHGKIYSHHKTKETALRAARKIARKKDATVMVQNIDGTFSRGFKPRTA